MIQWELFSAFDLSLAAVTQVERRLNKWQKMVSFDVWFVHGEALHPSTDGASAVRPVVRYHAI